MPRQALAPDRYAPSPDDELGHALLDKPAARNPAGLAFYNRDADMAGTALLVSRHVLERSGAGPRARAALRVPGRAPTREMDPRSLRRARVATQALAAAFLDAVMTVSGPLLPRASVLLEYRPYVQQMVRADDVLEAEAAAAAAEAEAEAEAASAAEAEAEAAASAPPVRQRQRRTRRRIEYARYMTVSAEGLEAARHMLLDPDLS